MHKVIKTLTRLSLILRKWTAVSSSISVIRPVQHIQQCNFANYSASQEENSQKHMDNKTFNETTHKEINSLLENLIDEQNSKNGFNAYATLHDLAMLYRQAKSNCQSEDIINHKGFSRLCEALMKRSTSMPPNRIVICLRDLHDLHVPFNSMIVQIFLQLVRPSINKLSLPMSVLLLRLLEQNTSTKLSKALYEASEIIFEEQLRTNLDTQDTETLLVCLQRVITSRNDKEINRILYAIWNLKKIDVNYLASIFFCLCHISNFSPTYGKLMDRVQYELAEELTNPTVANGLAWAEDKIIYFVTTKYKTKFKRFYNMTLMHGIVNNAISRKLPFETCVNIASFLSSIHQLDLPFLDFLAIQFCEKQDEVTLIQDNPAVFVKFIRNFAVSNYKPFLWESIRRQIMNLTEFKFSKEELISLCHSMAVLECDSPDLLKQLFDTLGDVKETDLHQREKFSLVRLYYTIKTFGTKYDGPLAEDSIKMLADDFYNHCMEQHLRHDLKEPLAKALGGEQYVQCNLRTKLGHFIDYAITIGKDGYPVPMSKCEEQEPRYLEDIQISPSDKIILILALPSVAYFDHRINGTWSMTLRSIEAYTGYDVVPINYTVCEKSDPTEHIPFIMQAIKLKCDALRGVKVDYGTKNHHTQINCQDSCFKNYISPDLEP